jgi:hypothetical protein
MKADISKKLKTLRKSADQAGQPSTPLASARLKKTQTEIAVLEEKLAVLRLEARQLAGELLKYEEAREIFGRPHVAARGMIEIMPKNLAPRIYGQSQREIERTLSQWCDKLTATIREAI